MATKGKKSKRGARRRLALPENLAKNLNEVRKNLKNVQNLSAKEAQKIYNKVIEIECQLNN